LTLVTQLAEMNPGNVHQVFLNFYLNTTKSVAQKSVS